MITVPSRLPEPLTLDLRFVAYRDQDADVWPQRAQQIRRSWQRLSHDIDAVMAAHGKHCWGSRGYQLTRLAKATGNAGWTTVAENVARFEAALCRLERMPDDGAGPFIGSAIGRAMLRPVRNTTPTQAQVAAFCYSVRRCQRDMRQLTGSAWSRVRDRPGRHG